MIEHQRRTRTEGCRGLLAILAIAAVAIVFQFCVFAEVWHEQWFSLILFYSIFVFSVSFAGQGVLKNFLANDEFRCCLTEEELDCYCPIRRYGETFKVQLSEIAKLEKETDAEGHRWYVWDTYGKRYWLTPLYGNPCERIIRRIKEFRPDVPQVDNWSKA